MAGIQDAILTWVQDGIPNIVKNSSSIFNTVLGFVGVIVFILWLYCGVIIFSDARKRYRVRNPFFYLFLLLFGMITGPFGLVLYIAIRPKNTIEELEFIKVEHKFYYHQASKVVDCLNCGAYVLEGQLHCTNCGFQNRFKCEKCEAITDYDDLYCSNCGSSFEGRYESILKKADRVEMQEEKVKDQTNLTPDLSKVKEISKKTTQKARESVKRVKEKAQRLIQSLKSKSQSKTAKK